jgi:hypothetical protein
MPYVLDQEQTQLYSDYGLNNSYTFVSGVFALPVATEDDTESPVDVVKAFAPYRVRNVSFAAKKNSTPPVIPAPESAGAFTFLGGEIAVPAPVPTTNHTFQWQVDGELTFICTAADSDGLILGNRPMIFEQQAAIPPADISDTMPEDVQLSGRGPVAGYLLGEAIDLENPAYLYPEISYYPSKFFSTALLTGINTYPNFT